MATIVACPGCGARLRIGEVPPSRTIRCPKCKEGFRPEEDEDESSQAYAVKPAPPVGESKRADRTRTAREEDDQDRPGPGRRLADEDDEDHDEDRPARRRRRLVNDEDDEDDERERRSPKGPARHADDSFDQPVSRVRLPGTKRAIILSILLLILAPFDLVVTVFEFYVAMSFPFDALHNLQQPGFQQLVALEKSLIIVHWSLVFWTFIVFCTWFYRVYANLALTKATGLEHSAGGAVGWFFVPFLNLYKPCVIAQEIWKASAPSALGGNWKGNDGSNLIGLWWFGGVAGLLLLELSRRLVVVSAGPNISSTMLRVIVFSVVISWPLFLLSEMCLVLVVRGVMRRQHKKLWLDR